MKRIRTLTPDEEKRLLRVLNGGDPEARELDRALGLCSGRIPLAAKVGGHIVPNTGILIQLQKVFSEATMVLLPVMDGRGRIQMKRLPWRVFDTWRKDHRLQPLAERDYLELARKPDSAWVVYGIANLHAAGQLWRLRKCTCGRWFLAPTRRREWCDTPCRRRHEFDNELQREKRRAYMKTYMREARKRERAEREKLLKTKRRRR